MNRFSRNFRRCVLVLFACTASVAFSQSREMEDLSVDALLKQSNAALIRIDAGSTDSVWDEASEVFREAQSKADFAARISAERTSAGLVDSRVWRAISRVTYPVGNVQRLPPGDYVNLNYLRRGSNGAALWELVSFRLENAAQWRLAGYVMEKTSNK